ncbi:DUF2723 domain-containing protein [bacterium]|nr:DUF2723 domain-containing protein [bacterium]
MHTKDHFIGAALTGILVLVAYILTMAPTVTFWDAGEFLSAAYTLGIPHPPGTPLFVNIGRVVCSLPLPFEIAPRLNFVSVLCGVASAVLIYLIAAHLLEKLAGNRQAPGRRLVVLGGAAAAAIIPAFLFTEWTNVTEFEVYAAAMATILLCSWLCLKMGSVDNPLRTQRILLLIIYLVALSIANHLIVLLVAPAVVVYVLLNEPERRNYWLSIILSLVGLYIMVLKGLDLDKVGATLDKHHSGGPLHLGTILWSLVSGLPEVLFRLGAHVQSWGAFILGLLLSVAALWWAGRKRALGFVWLAAALFLLGFSIHLFLLIRSGLNPPLNEGNPSTFAAFWAEIGREQYGSAYGLLPRQAWTVITGKTAVTSLSDLVENIQVFFAHNVPFYTKYFGWQYGGPALSFLFFLIGLYGAFEHWRIDRKSFWFWLTVFLVTGMVLNIYMNFKLEFMLSRDKYPGNGLHEVRERDYFFLVSFVFFGVWSGLGLAALVNRLRSAMLGSGAAGPGERTVFGVLGTALLCTAFLPMGLNWSKAERSGNHIPQVYARNVLNSLDKDAILFTNGDNDTFPLWYAQEVEGLRKDCRVVNLSLLNLNWYIRQMRDREPRLPIGYSDSTLDKLYGFVLEKPMRFRMDSVDLSFDKGETIWVKDIIVLDIVRNNHWKRPIYFTNTTPPDGRTKLNPYCTMEGMVTRLNPEKAEALALRDSAIAPTGDPNTYVNIRVTDSLYSHVYKFDTFFDQGRKLEGEDAETLNRTGSPLVFLSFGQNIRGDLESSLQTRLLARKFLTQGGNWSRQLDYTLGSLLLELGRPAEAFRMLDSLSAPPMLYSSLAETAANNGKPALAVSILHHTLEVHPDYREGYAHLFMLQNHLGRQDSASAALQMYLKQFPADTVVAQELERYQTTGDFNLTRAFNIAPQKRQ